MSQQQKKVYSILKNSKLHRTEQHWNSFSIVNEKLSKQIESESELQYLKNSLVFARIKEFKETVYENSKRQSPNNRLTCYYCEEIMDDKKRRANNCRTIEHIIGKGKYSEYTLAPFNLIPICNACNTAKNELEVTEDDNPNLYERTYKIIHPYKDNKEDYLSFIDDIGIWKVVNDSDERIVLKAKNTINFYNLNSSSNTLGELRKKNVEMNEINSRNMERLMQAEPEEAVMLLLELRAKSQTEL